MELILPVFRLTFGR